MAIAVIDVWFFLPDDEARKRRDRTGLETRVAYALNYEY